MSFLEQITDARRADARTRVASLPDLQAAAAAALPARDFAGALSGTGVAVIAEVKRASPSAGDIVPGADAVERALAYEAGGARAVSVLTEPDYFKGSLDDLRAVHAAIELPVIRKDFIGEPLQVWEARAAGADAILLIVAALTQTELVSLQDLAERLGMAALIETHSADEVARARDAGARIIGINARNLATLEVDLAVVTRLCASLPDNVIKVGESGVRTAEDVRAMADAGCDAVLVGETLMRAPDPAAAIRGLLASIV
jgi:indole-3-glycerol phosphate synthase